MESGTKGKRSKIPYLFIAPIVILSGCIIYFCIFFTLRISVSDWNGLDPDIGFVGLDNFAGMLSDRVFWVSLLNNMIFMFSTVFIQAAVGLLIAIFLTRKPPFMSFFKSVFFMPVVMAPIIIAAIFRIIMDTNVGSLNTALRSIGLGFMAVSWLGAPQYALLSVILVNVFEWTGFSMILYYAGLLAIPEDLYESAKIDGAGFLTTLWKVTVPMLRGTTSAIIVLGIVGSLKTFDIVYMLTNGGPGVSTEFLTTFLYKRAFDEYNSGYASAVGVFILALAAVLSAIQIGSYNESKRKNG
jgi:raffinose/stachyose/melibiose transport system permease protein